MSRLDTKSPKSKTVDNWPASWFWYLMIGVQKLEHRGPKKKKNADYSRRLFFHGRCEMVICFAVLVFLPFCRYASRTVNLCTHLGRPNIARTQFFLGVRYLQAIWTGGFYNKISFSQSLYEFKQGPALQWCTYRVINLLYYILILKKLISL